MRESVWESGWVMQPLTDTRGVEPAKANPEHTYLFLQQQAVGQSFHRLAIFNGMNKPLTKEFFNRPTLRIAKELLGKYLVRRIGKKIIARQITEVEAYVGFTDLASQASRGKTKRNYVMFGRPGHWYVYFTYGMHWMVNVVTERDGHPGAVLLRGVDGVSGPGCLTKFLKIDRELNTKPVSRKTGLWIEDRGVKVPSRKIKRSPRIGIYCESEWRDKLWRFYL